MYLLSLIDKIKENVDLSTYIAKYVQINAKGWSCCPLHSEKTPSFKIYPNGSWYCFGCNKGGDIFNFVMEIEGIPFREALKKLVYLAGIEMNNYQPKESSISKVNQVLKELHYIEIWQKVIKFTDEMVVSCCRELNGRLKELYDLPWPVKTHRIYTNILLLEEKFDYYNSKGDILLGQMAEQLEKHKQYLKEIKKNEVKSEE